MNNQIKFNAYVYGLMSIVNFKLSFTETKSLIFNPSLVNNFPQLTEQEKTSLLEELDNK